MGELAVSRAFGDSEFKKGVPVKVTIKPTTSQFILNCSIYDDSAGQRE